MLLYYLYDGYAMSTHIIIYMILYIIVVGARVARNVDALKTPHRSYMYSIIYTPSASASALVRGG